MAEKVSITAETVAPVPDCTGVYTETGEILNAKKVYSNGTYFLFYNGGDEWYITDESGSTGGTSWFKESNVRDGQYIPHNFTTGNVIVTAIVEAVNAKIDDNGRQTIIGTSSVDGTTIVAVGASPTTHGILIDDNTTGSDLGNNNDNANLDDNSRQVLTALSSDDDGKIIELYVDIDSKLLVNSN